MRALFESAFDAILFVDSSGRYVDANPAASALLGYTHEEIGETLGIPVGTSKARLFDARAKLRAALAPFAGDYSA